LLSGMSQPLKTVRAMISMNLLCAPHQQCVVP
jgi:hypothetical protein